MMGGGGREERREGGTGGRGRGREGGSGRKGGTDRGREVVSGTRNRCKRTRAHRQPATHTSTPAQGYTQQPTGTHLQPFITTARGGGSRERGGQSSTAPCPRHRRARANWQRHATCEHRQPLSAQSCHPPCRGAPWEPRHRPAPAHHHCCASPGGDRTCADPARAGRGGERACQESVRGSRGGRGERVGNTNMSHGHAGSAHVRDARQRRTVCGTGQRNPRLNSTLLAHAPAHTSARTSATAPAPAHLPW